MQPAACVLAGANRTLWVQLSFQTPLPAELSTSGALAVHFPYAKGTAANAVNALRWIKIDAAFVGVSVSSAVSRGWLSVMTAGAAPRNTSRALFARWPCPSPGASPPRAGPQPRRQTLRPDHREIQTGGLRRRSGDLRQRPPCQRYGHRPATTSYVPASSGRSDPRTCPSRITLSVESSEETPGAIHNLRVESSDESVESSEAARRRIKGLAELSRGK